MTMTEERAIAGYAENPQQPDLDAAGAQPPNLPFGEDTSGSVDQVQRQRGERSPCDICSKLILTKNMNHHKREVHGIYIRKRGKNGGDKAVDSKAQPPKQDVVKEKPLTTDEIVAVVVQMRWPHHMPSNKMPALLEWRAATERFLNG